MPRSTLNFAPRSETWQKIYIRCSSGYGTDAVLSGAEKNVYVAE
jgi:hypothetical protein